MNASALSTKKYLGDLQLQLHFPGVRIGEIVAEVEAHTAESGETPESGRTVVTVLAATLGGWLSVVGSFHLTIGQQYLGVSPVMVFVEGLLILGGVFTLPLNVIVDPRTSQRPDILD